MKNRLIVLLLVLLFVLSLISCQNGTAENESETEEITKTLDFYALSDGTYGVKVKETEAAVLEEIAIPSAYEGKPVTELSDEAFKDCKNLKTVTIPDSVKRVGVNAFVGCNALKSMTLPFLGADIDSEKKAFLGYLFGGERGSENGNVVPADLNEVVVTGGTVIGNAAFRNCDHLTSITISDSVTKIGAHAMEGCRRLERVVLPFIGSEENGKTGTFFGYLFGADSLAYNKDYVPKSLKRVEFMRGNTIAEKAFIDCSNIEYIKIPSSVEIIEESAFSRCRGLITVEFEKDSQLKEIGEAAFQACSSLVNIEIPFGVTTLGMSAFDQCRALEFIEIPDSVESVVSLPFSNCGNLKNIRVGRGVTIIDYMLLSDCGVLESITLSDAVTTIKFDYMDYVLPSHNLTYIYYEGSFAQWQKIAKDDANFWKQLTVYYYSESQPSENGKFWHYVNGVPTAW